MKTPQWERWFAWRPVKIDGKWIWLRAVERRWTPPYAHDVGFWDYRDGE